MFETLSPALRERDPLVDGCAALGARRAVAELLGAALEAWMAPAFEKLEPVFGDRDPVLLAAACRLAEFGAHLHPDHRADLIFDQVLRAPIPGMDHPERVFLACAAFARHTTAAPTLREPRTRSTACSGPSAFSAPEFLGARDPLGLGDLGRPQPGTARSRPPDVPGPTRFSSKRKRRGPQRCWANSTAKRAAISGQSAGARTEDAGHPRCTSEAGEGGRRLQRALLSLAPSIKLRGPAPPLRG